MNDNENGASEAPQPPPTTITTQQQPNPSTYTPLDVFVKEVKYEDGSQKEYQPMTIDLTERHNPKFGMPGNVDVTIQGLIEPYFSDRFLKSIRHHTNIYGRQKGRAEFKDISEEDLLFFFSIIFYMGVVRLPAKKDYFESDGMWPAHKATQRMSYHRFETIWRFIHLIQQPQGAEAEPEGETEENQENEEGVDDVSNEGDSVEQVDTRWYAKAAPFIDQVNKVSQQLCKWPGFSLSIDEQMKRFKGRSAQTFRMKNEPVKEGCKFWAICDASTGFCYKVMPAARVGRADEEGRKVIDSVLSLIDSIPHRENKKHVVGMDNCFTWPRVIIGARERKVAVVGTAKGKRGWPPRELKSIKAV